MHLPCGSPDKSNPDAINIKYKKKSRDARTHFCWLGITKHSAQPGDCSLSAPPSLIQVQYPARDYLATLHSERAHTRPYTILRQTVKSPSNSGWLRSSPERIRGTFPPGSPDTFRRTAPPSVRGLPRRNTMKTGADRDSRLRRGCCCSAALYLGVLQQPLLRFFTGNVTVPQFSTCQQSELFT